MARNSLFESSNPFLKAEKFQATSHDRSAEGRMTVQGAINKTFLLFGILLLTGAIGFSMPNPVFLFGGAIGALIVAIVASFRPHLSPTLAPAYAALEGLFLGGVTFAYSYAYNGIVFQAVTLTLSIMFTMLMVYKYRWIEVTDRFRMILVMATGGIALLYLSTWILSLFGIHMPFMHNGGWLGIGLNMVIVVIAALNLLLDFDNFDKGQAYGAPRYMEWFSAMGLMITLVWLYLELLRLLARMSSRD